MKKRNRPSVDASSMADIAFLLLVFFLVTTSMDVDKGILVQLPPSIEAPDPPEPEPYHAREVLEVLINSKDQLLVEGRRIEVSELKAETKKHLLNYGVLADYSSLPSKAIVSLQNDRNTSYESYISVYNELKAAYREVREFIAMREFNLEMELLNKDQMRKLRKELVPLRLSESDPFELK